MILEDFWGSAWSGDLSKTMTYPNFDPIGGHLKRPRIENEQSKTFKNMVIT